MRRHKFITVALLGVLVAVSASGLALAQASNRFDLGCWGALTTAGGEQQTANFRLTYTVGQVTAGGAASPHVQLRIGYSQDWRTLHPAVPTPDPTIPTPSPTITSPTATLYLPLIGRYVTIIRSCNR